MVCPVCNDNEVEPGELCVDCHAPEGVVEILRELTESYFADSKPHPGIRPEVQELGKELSLQVAAAKINHIFRAANK